MGNVEVVHPGSKQVHPSCESYDSGVDDLNDPKHYIVWDMKKNTHIYPLYAVGFKVSSDAGGNSLIHFEFFFFFFLFGSKTPV